MFPRAGRLGVAMAATDLTDGSPEPEPEPEPEHAVALAARLLTGGRRVTVLTGAGISTDSGIPDFRGPNGVWTRNPRAERTSTLADYLTDERVRAQAWRNRLTSPVWDARPNRGHRALLELERRGRLRALLTQNVDGLHQQAGSSPAVVVELHGSMRGVRCRGCGAGGPMTAALDRVRAGEVDPHCTDCGGILKSTTVSFGERLDPDVVRRARDAALDCDVLLAVGSTLTVKPAAALVPLAKRSGAAIVIVNGEATPYDAVADAVVRGSISDLLPRLLATVG